MVAAVVAFAATNVDGLFLTAALLSAAPSRPWPVVGGTYLGIGALYAVSVALALAAAAIPDRYIALLGLVPLALGLKQLFSRQEEQLATGQGVLAVAGINIAAGGDNIGVYTPLFAITTGEAIAVYGAVFAVLTGALCWAAHRLVTHPALGAPVRRWGPRAVPYVLIGLGLWILLF